MSRKNELAEDLREYIFEMLDNEIEFSGMDAGQIAHVIERAFNAAYDSKPPRWRIGDKFLLRSKTRRECTITNIIRSFPENGNMTTIYRASHDFMGQKISDTYSETTIARGRMCQDTGKVIESGQELADVVKAEIEHRHEEQKRQELAKIEAEKEELKALRARIEQIESGQNPPQPRIRR